MNTPGKLWVSIILVVGILGGGLFASILISNRIDTKQRSALLKEAQQAALLAPASIVAPLTGSSADLQSATYQALKQNLTAFRLYNPSTRFVYVLGYRPEIRTQFFYVDSEPVESKDYSAPGALFPDTRQEDIDKYLAGKPYTDGPYNDSWGQWVSAYAPIKDTQGNVVALLGIDTATSVWHEQIGFVRTVVALIAVLLSIVVVCIITILHKRQRSIDFLQRENRTLIHTEGKLKELQSMAQLGRINIYFPDQLFSFDGQLAVLFSIGEHEKIEKTRMDGFVHHDDRVKFDHFIGEITDTDISYAWVDIRLGTTEKGFRTYHIYGNIERNELLAPTRFSGIIQDITDIHTS
jgi:hypothetical protein